MLKLILNKVYFFYMKKKKVLVFIIIFISLLLLTARGIFALSGPTEIKVKEISFSGYRVNQDRTTAQINNGQVRLPGQAGAYNNSAVVWTKNIDFHEDIQYLTITADSILPAGTTIFCYVIAKDQIKEHRINFGNRVEMGKFMNLGYGGSVEEIKLKLFLSTDNTNVTPILKSLTLKGELRNESQKAKKRRDYRKAYDLNKVKDLLADYYEDFGHYPVVNLNKDQKDDQWSILRSILDSASKHMGGNYLWRFPDQVEDVSTEYKYGYLTNSIGSYYILWTKLETKGFSSSYLEDSWHGMAAGVDCSAYHYCLYHDPHNVAGDEPTYLREFGDNNGDSGNNVYFSGGTFVRKKGDTKVYLKVAGKRVWLRTPEIFYSVGGSWDKVYVKNYLTSPKLKFIKKANGPKIYILSNGFKRHALNPDVLHLYGGYGNVVNLSSGLVNAIPDAKLLKAKNDSKVYYISEDTKRWVTTPEVLGEMNFNFSQITEVDPVELDYYYEGSPFF